MNKGTVNKNVVMVMAMLVGMVASSAQAALVAHWEFETVLGGGAGSATPSSVDSPAKDATLSDATHQAKWDTTTTGFGADILANVGGRAGNQLFLSNTNTNTGLPDDPNAVDSNDYAIADTFQGIGGSGARSVAVWLYQDSSLVTPQSDQMIVAWGGNADGSKSNGNAWTIRLRSNGLIQTAPGDTNIKSFPATPLPVDQWFHLAVAWELGADGVNSSDDLSVYVDGVLAANINGGAPFTKVVNTDLSNDNRVTIGTTHSADGSAHQRGWAGGMDDFRIYDHKLSQAEVNALVGPGTAGDFDQDGDVDGADFLLWQRDTGVGTLTDWQNNFGTTASLPAAGAVPEPASAVLAICVAMSAMGLTARRRRT